MEGRLMLRQEQTGNAAIAAALPKGAYVYRIVSGRVYSSGRMVVQ
jgi:hypothetical protein